MAIFFKNLIWISIYGVLCLQLENNSKLKQIAHFTEMVSKNDVLTLKPYYYYYYYYCCCCCCYDCYYYYIISIIIIIIINTIITIINYTRDRLGIFSRKAKSVKNFLLTKKFKNVSKVSLLLLKIIKAL